MLGSWVALDDERLHEEMARIEGRRLSPIDAVHARRLFAAALETPGGLKVQTIHAFCARLLRANALDAQDIFTRLGRADVGWQALAVAGKASRLAGDENAAREFFNRAATSLTQFEQSLGADSRSYDSRPDVQWLRS